MNIGIAHIVAVPSSVQALEDLGVAGNRLRALPQSIGRVSSLGKLALNGNLLEELPDSLAHLTGLQQLWLQCNQLRRIDPVSQLQVPHQREAKLSALQMAQRPECDTLQ